jgi:copper chaperone
MTVTQHYVVAGMTCAHCVSSVTEEVSALVGVTDVAVDLPSGSLTVTSDAEIDFSEIEAAVDEAGYTVLAA